MLHFGIMIYLLIAIVICLVIFLYRIKRLEQRVFKPPHLKPYGNDDAKCVSCKHRQTMNCPNSNLCYSTNDKPFFEKSDDEDEFHIRP